MAKGLPLLIHSFIHSFNKTELAPPRFQAPASSSWFNCSLKDVSFVFPRDKGPVLSWGGPSAPPRWPQQPLPEGPRPTRAPSAPASTSPRRGEPGPQRPPRGTPREGQPGALGRGRLAPRPPSPARSGPAPPGQRRPRLTRVLATFPLWVIFLLCFSLAIRMRCLATMARALGNALDSHLQGSPPSVSPRQGQARPAGPGRCRWQRAAPEPRAPRSPAPNEPAPERGQSPDGSNLSSQETLSYFLAILPVPPAT